MTAPNPPRRTPNKNELLDWLNCMIRDTTVKYSKIEHLGAGVGYLLLLNAIHPGILTGVRYNRSPSNQYEYLLNLKILATAFGKLGINKAIDIDKLSKLKLQDNLAMLQWFYAYAEEFRQGKAAFEDGVKETLKAALPKKIKLKPPVKLTAEKLVKTNVEQPGQAEIKIVSSATKKINEIQSIIHDRKQTENEVKLRKIMSILNIGRQKPHRPIYDHTPQRNTSVMNPYANSLMVNRSGIEEKDENQNNLNRQEEAKQVTYVKSTRLQDRYEQYMRNSILKKPASHTLTSQSRSKSKRVSIRHGQKSGVFEYEPQGRKSSLRLTENSILLHSDTKSNGEDRKSLVSQTDLLKDVLQDV